MENQETRYLYGAAVQGIQAFVFSTNELKDIVGASELVDSICKECFQEFSSGGEIIVSAAGNIKCVFKKEEDCKKAVREFPRKVMIAAPGITISQAVVKMTPGQRYGDVADLLETKLRAQRNRPYRSMTAGLMGMERAPKTGLPAYAIDKGTAIDLATWKKRAYSRRTDLFFKFFGNKVPLDAVAWNFEDMTRQNAWIAVIHADGNSLGEVVANVGKDEKMMAEFSHDLERATSLSANQAYQDLAEKCDIKGEKEIIPVRPIVLGGDDLTIVCRGDLALPFTESFIRHFEENTKPVMEKLKDRTQLLHLTACAGIAFIKSSYPFYYGYRLAELLCSRAKQDTKKNGIAPAPSCVMFHKVQSSFVEEYDEIALKELTPCKGHSYEYGPYYLREMPGRWTIEKLTGSVKNLEGKEGNAIKADIRQWLTFMADTPLKAKKKRDRVMKISPQQSKEIFKTATDYDTRNGIYVYPAYDILSLHSISMTINHRNTLNESK